MDIPRFSMDVFAKKMRVHERFMYKSTMYMKVHSKFGTFLANSIGNSPLSLKSEFGKLKGYFTSLN